VVAASILAPANAAAAANYFVTRSSLLA